MKKLNLNVADLGATEILSREELKKVLGGTGTGTGTGSGATDCTADCSDGTQVEITNCNGTCTAKNYVKVTCKGKTTTIIKKCPA